MTAVSPVSQHLEGPSVLGALARVWLSLLLFLQLVGFAAAAPGGPADAGLGRSIGSAVTLCRHGDGRSPGHDGGSGHGDCCELGLCSIAHQDFALVPTIVAPPPRARFGSHRDRATAFTVAVLSLLAGTASPRGPPSRL